MTTVCSGGPSAARAGVDASIVVDQAYIQSLLPSGLAWAYPYLPYMHGLEIGDVGAFCAVDPPTWSVPTATEIFNFIAGGPISSYLVVNQFLQDVTKAYLWYSLCECTTVTTPAPPAAPSAPADLPAINPPDVVTLPPTDACASATGTPVLSVCNGNNPGLGVSMPLAGLNVTSVRVTVVVSNTTGAGFPATVSVLWQSRTATIRSDNIGSLPGGAGTFVFVSGPPAAGTYQVAGLVAGTGSGCADFTATMEFFCDGDTPGGTDSFCCPPDPVMTALLRRIDQTLTLIQRQAVPFSYVDGAAHTGLTGNGEISLQGVIGARIDITTVPARAGQTSGHPTEHYDLGWIAWGDATGFGPRELLHHEEQLSLPARASVYTRLGYSLAPDVVIDVQELEREP